MPQPAEVRQLADELAEVYRSAWQRIVDDQRAVLTSLPALRRPARAAALRDLQALVEDLMGSVDEQALRWVVDDLPRSFLLGAASGGARGLAGLDLDALAVLAADTYADLLTATKGVRDSTKLLIRELGKMKVSDLLVRGQTAQRAGAELARDLAGRGITSVTYANGSRHGLADYSDMLLRTKTAQAYNQGTLGALGKAGVGYVEVFDGFGCGWTSHTDSDTANGTVRTLEDAAMHTISHPRCQRSFGGRPDVTDDEQARSAPRSQTPEQVADQRLVAQERLAAVARRAAARQLQGQVARRAVRLIEDQSTRVASERYARRVAARQVRLERARRRGRRTPA